MASLLPCERRGLFGAFFQRASAMSRPHDGIGCAWATAAVMQAATVAPMVVSWTERA
jgi:hypothetical protein